MKNLKIILLSAFLIFTLYSFTAVMQEKWVVPAEYENMTNPTENNKENLEMGKTLYNQQCKSCHGVEGYGDGPKADGLDTEMGDFTLEEFQSQSDGALFYKTKEGRDEMPAFKKKISDDKQIWYIVSYLRALTE